MNTFLWLMNALSEYWTVLVHHRIISYHNTRLFSHYITRKTWYFFVSQLFHPNWDAEISLSPDPLRKHIRFNHFIFLEKVFFLRVFFVFFFFSTPLPHFLSQTMMPPKPYFSSPYLFIYPIRSIHLFASLLGVFFFFSFPLSFLFSYFPFLFFPFFSLSFLFSLFSLIFFPFFFHSVQLTHNYDTSFALIPFFSSGEYLSLSHTVLSFLLLGPNYKIIVHWWKALRKGRSSLIFVEVLFRYSALSCVRQGRLVLV